MSRKHERQHDQSHVKSNIEIAMEKAKAMGGAPAAAEPRPGAVVPEDELKALREKAAKADECYDRMLRAAADLENYKKRVEREKSELLKFGQEGLMAEIIPVLDNFDRALSAAGSPTPSDPVLEGVKLIRKQLLAALEHNGLQPIEAVGQPFNPELHEALAKVETDDQPEGTIVTEHLKGYLLNGRLLRPAAVTVAVPKRTSGAGEEDRKLPETSQ